MKYYTTKEVIARIEERRKTNKPKMVYEIDYKRLQKESKKIQKRLETCIDALILDLNGVKEALSFVEFENRIYRRRLNKQRKKLEELTATVPPVLAECPIP